MKKKIGAILLMVALVLALGLVPAAPAAANGVTLCIHLETLSVDAKGAVATSSTTPASGVNYIIEASGTYSAGAVWDADAEYGTEDSWANYTDVPGTSDPSEPHLELWVDGASVEWGVYNAGHVYTLNYTGTGSSVTFQIEDTHYPNNLGQLTVKIYRCVTVTPIKTDTFDWTAPNNGTTGHVEIVEMMLNETDTTALYDAMGVSGVTGEEAFVYQVTNVSWVPIVGVNGFSGFNIVNQFDVDTVGNAFGPPGWEAFAGYSGTNTLPNPDNFEWDIKDSAGNGLLVGQTGLFGYTVAAGKYIDVSYGTGHWMHSWLSDIQEDITYQEDISGPASFISKELTAGPTVVALHADEEWDLTITVTNNDAFAAMTGVVVQDNFGGDLELLKVNGEPVTQPTNKKDTWSATSGADVDVMWTGKTLKAHLWWDVGTLVPRQTETLTVVVSTDINPGQGKKTPPKNEYTETGTHCLNSGATATGMLDGWEVIASSDEICVEVTEAVLILENKDSGWQRIPDGTWGELGYNLAGDEFDFALNVYDLEPEEDYSLIYYADTEDRYVDWGGDNPGALIATMTTDENGNVCISGSIDLGWNLPHPDDANGYYYDYALTPDFYLNGTGAKIWLVPSDCYNAGAKKVDTWSPTRFLFETDLITYDDTDV